MIAVDFVKYIQTLEDVYKVESHEMICNRFLFIQILIICCPCDCV